MSTTWRALVTCLDVVQWFLFTFEMLNSLTALCFLCVSVHFYVAQLASVFFLHLSICPLLMFLLPDSISRAACFRRIKNLL